MFHERKNGRGLKRCTWGSGSIYQQSHSLHCKTSHLPLTRSWGHAPFGIKTQLILRWGNQCGRSPFGGVYLIRGLLQHDEQFIPCTFKKQGERLGVNYCQRHSLLSVRTSQLKQVTNDHYFCRESYYGKGRYQCCKCSLQQEERYVYCSHGNIRKSRQLFIPYVRSSLHSLLHNGQYCRT